jgi:hypothetical protein
MFENRISHLPLGPDSDPRGRDVSRGRQGGSFVVLPCNLAPAAWQIQLYQVAYERARAELEQPPSRPAVVFSQN